MNEPHAVTALKNVRRTLRRLTGACHKYLSSERKALKILRLFLHRRLKIAWSLSSQSKEIIVGRDYHH